jgi:hypothetical protein
VTTESPAHEDSSGTIHEREVQTDATGPYPARVVSGLGLVALLAVAATTTLRALYNLPFDTVAVSPGLRTLAGGVTLVVLAAGLVALALTTDRTPVRVGLLFVAVFGVLPAFARAATLPGVVGVVTGSGVALGATLGVGGTHQFPRRAAVALGFVVGSGLSLAATTGLIDAGLRGLASLLVVGSLLGVGIRVEGDRLAAAVGVTAFVVTVGLTGANPYVAGSALLVSFAVVGVPYLLVTAAVGSCVAAATAALRRGEYATACGAGLLVVAGMPATFPRALAVLLGATLVLLPVSVLAGVADPTTVEPEVGR